jgi:ribonuclease BN (tRNA processing enzyme)
MSVKVEKDEVVLIGTKGGPSIRNIGVSTMPTSTLVDLGGHRLIVDCGLGVTRGIRESGRSITSISHILLTHYHSDHILELGGLLSTAWTSGLDHIVHLFGPEGLEECWEGFCKAMKFDLMIRQIDEGRPNLMDLVVLHTYGEGLVWDHGGLVIRALKNLHPPVEQSYALRFDYSDTGGTKSVFISGDTTYFEPLAKFAEGCSIVIHEAMLESGVDFVVAKTGNTDHRLKAHLLAAHTTARDAGRIAGAARAQTLVLHHLIPPERDVAPDEEWLAQATIDHPSLNVVVAFDGMKLPIPCNISAVSQNTEKTATKLPEKMIMSIAPEQHTLVQDVIISILNAAKSTKAYKRYRTHHGLTLGQLEEFCVFTMLVIMRVKDAYLVDNMGFGNDSCKLCSGSAQNGNYKCIRSLVQDIQTALAPVLGLTNIACVCISQGGAAHDWGEDSFDFLLMRAHTLQEKLLSIGHEDKREDMSKNTAFNRFTVFGEAHPFLIDVSAGTGAPTRMESSSVTAIASLVQHTFPSISSDKSFQFINLESSALIQEHCGYCFLAGWLLGYPCIYKNSTNQQSDNVNENSLSMQLLRKNCIAVTSADFLVSPVTLDVSSLTSKSGAEVSWPIGGYLRAREGVSILEFTVPLSILESDEQHATKFTNAVEHQLEQARHVLSPSVSLTCTDIQLPSVMM